MKLKNLKLLLIGFITGIINGLFGSGGGTIIVPSLAIIIGLEEKKAHATAISIILPITLLSSFIYISNGSINLKELLYVTSGSVIGGFVGAKLLNKMSNRLLRKIFGIFMIIASYRLVIKWY